MKELYYFELQPETSLHIGSGDFDKFFGAGGIFKNGKNEAAVPGSSIAGAFIGTLRDVVDGIEEDDLFWRITGAEKKDKTASILWFRSWFSDKAIQNLRDRLCVEPATRAAADGEKFAHWEIAPHELSIGVIVGIEDRDVDKCLGKIRSWIDAVVWSWMTEGVALGAFSAAGLGWCHLNVLNGLKRFEVNRASHELYMDTPVNQLHEKKEHWYPVMPAEAPVGQKQRYYIYDLNVSINDICGIEALLIKGDQQSFSLKENAVDMAFIHDGYRLFIPGSSIKGAIKAFIRRYHRSLLSFFGSEDEGGMFLLADLGYSGDPCEYLLPVERHAEDELTRAVLGGGKFNEERLFAGSFSGKVRIPVHNEGWDKVHRLLEGGFKHRLIGLGAGCSYPEITLTSA